MATPFATIAAGAKVAQPGDTVWVHAGTYREEVAPPRDGLPGLPITISAWSPDDQPWTRDRPVVTTFRPIIPGQDGVGTWQNQGGDLWSISLPASYCQADGENLVSVDGVIHQEARWPDTPLVPDFTRDYAAWSTTGAVLGENVSGTLDLGRYISPQLSGLPDAGLVGARMIINPGKQWVPQLATVTEKAGTSITFLWERFGGTLGGWGVGNGDPNSQDWMVLRGRLALLSRADEFYLNVDGGMAAEGPIGTLWLRQSTSPDGSAVEMRRVSNVVNLTARSDVVIRGLILRAGQLYAGPASRRLEISECTFEMDGPGSGPDSAILLDGVDHRVSDCDIDGASGSGIVLGNSCTAAVVTGLTISNCGNTGIVASLNSNSLTIADCTVWDTGAHGVSFNSYDSDYGNLHVYRWGRRCADIGGINAWEYFDRPLNDRIHHCWVHDSMGFDLPGGRWTKGGGIRGDGGGNHGVAGYTIDHCVVQNGGDIDITAFALAANQIGAGAANVRIINNTIGGQIYLSPVAGTLTGGFLVVNNVAASLPPAWRTNALERCERNLNSSTSSPRFADVVSREWSLSANSNLIDAGDPVAPLQSGYSGIAPDIGAYEVGSALWVPGAHISPRHLANLRIAGRTRHDGKRFAVVTGLPVGRLLSTNAKLRVSGIELTGQRWSYDGDTNRGECWFPLPIPEPVDGPATIDLGDGAFLPLPNDVTGLRSRITDARISGGILTVTGAGLAGPIQDLWEVSMDRPDAKDLAQRPVLLRLALGALGLKSDASDLGMVEGLGSELKQLPVEIEWGNSTLLQGWTGPAPATAVMGPALNGRTYAIRTPQPLRGSVVSAGWPILMDGSLYCRMRPETATQSTISAGLVQLTAPNAASQPTWVDEAMAGLPALYFDGGDRLTAPTGLGNGPNTLLSIYRTTSTSGEKAPVGSWPRLLSSGPYPDYVNGYALTPACTSTGAALPIPQPAISWLPVTNSTARDTIRLGATAGTGVNSHPFIGWMGESLAFSRVLTRDEVLAAQSYLKVKYRMVVAGRFYGKPTTPTVKAVRANLGSQTLTAVSAAEGNMAFLVPAGAAGNLSVTLSNGVVLTWPSGSIKAIGIASDLPSASVGNEGAGPSQSEMTSGADSSSGAGPCGAGGALGLIALLTLTRRRRSGAGKP